MANSKMNYSWLDNSPEPIPYDEFCRRYVYRIGRAAACSCCKSTISGKSEEELDDKLMQHFQKAHNIHVGDSACTLCVCSIGSTGQVANSAPAHDKCNRHVKYTTTANRVCLTCAAVNPQPDHNRDHKIRDFFDVVDKPDFCYEELLEDVSGSRGSDSPQYASVADKAGMLELMLAISQKSSSATGRRTSVLPCTKCFDCNITSKIACDAVYEGGRCPRCALTGGTGAAREVVWYADRVFPDRFESSRFRATLSKAEWMSLDDCWQDCFEMRQRVATLVVASAKKLFRSWATVPAVMLVPLDEPDGVGEVQVANQETGGADQVVGGGESTGDAGEEQPI